MNVNKTTNLKNYFLLSVLNTIFFKNNGFVYRFLLVVQGNMFNKLCEFFF